MVSMPATHRPLGAVVCISPWNFPLAIFTGQIAAALAAGNVVLAKPAEETCLIAAEGVASFGKRAFPRGALQFLPGAGEVGAAHGGEPGDQGRHVHHILFGLVSVGVVGLIVWFPRDVGPDTLLSIGLGLLLGGAIGNMIDRFRFGYVVDWVDAGIGDLRFYTFNVADSMIIAIDPPADRARALPPARRRG